MRVCVIYYIKLYYTCVRINNKLRSRRIAVISQISIAFCALNVDFNSKLSGPVVLQRFYAPEIFLKNNYYNFEYFTTRGHKVRGYTYAYVCIFATHIQNIVRFWVFQYYNYFYVNEIIKIIFFFNSDRFCVVRKTLLAKNDFKQKITETNCFKFVSNKF